MQTGKYVYVCKCIQTVAGQNNHLSAGSLCVTKLPLCAASHGTKGGGRSGEGVKMSSIAVFVFSHKGDLIRIMGKITNIALRLLHAII